MTKTKNGEAKKPLNSRPWNESGGWFRSYVFTPPVETKKWPIIRNNLESVRYGKYGYYSLIGSHRRAYDWYQN